MGKIAALFDLDRTLLDTSSGQLYARYLYRQGKMGRRELSRAIWWGILSRLGILDMHELIPRLLVDAMGDDEQELRRQCDQWFAQDVIPHITEIGRSPDLFLKASRSSSNEE